MLTGRAGPSLQSRTPHREEDEFLFLQVVPQRHRHAATVSRWRGPTSQKHAKFARSPNKPSAQLGPGVCPRAGETVPRTNASGTPLPCHTTHTHTRAHAHTHTRNTTPRPSSVPLHRTAHTPGQIAVAFVRTNRPTRVTTPRQPNKEPQVYTTQTGEELCRTDDPLALAYTSCREHCALLFKTRGRSGCHVLPVCAMRRQVGQVCGTGRDGTGPDGAFTEREKM